MFDLIILCFLSLMAEFFILKEKYMFFSPFTNFNLMFFIVYLLPPLLFYIDPGSSNFFLLNTEEIKNGYLFIRTFYYPWFIFSLIFFIKNKKENISITKGTLKIPPIYLLFVWILLIGTYIICISAPLNFNPSLTLSRLINPRAFTYIREGYGPLNTLLSCVKLIMLLLSIRVFVGNKSLVNTLLLTFAITVNILGGSKLSFINFLIVIVMLSYKMDFKFKKVSFLKIFSFGFFGFSLLSLSFMFFYTPGKVFSFKEAVQNMIGYQKEAFYTLQILNDFKWQPQYAMEGIYDTLTPFIPRFIWEEKPFSGFYFRYWRAAYEPETVIYHTSTTGTLSEAYMMFGYLGGIIYAIWFYYLCKWVYLKFQKTNSLFVLFVVCYLQICMYFFIRFGILSTTVVSFVYQFIIAYIFLVIIRNLFFRKSLEYKEKGI